MGKKGKLIYIYNMWCGGVDVVVKENHSVRMNGATVKVRARTGQFNVNIFQN